MTAPENSRSEKARQFYNAAAITAGDFSFMNYGFAPLSAELSPDVEPECYCLQLYRHVLGEARLGGRRLIEVSSGRGGGAAHVARTYRPAELIGIDISEQNIRLAEERFADVPGLRFQPGSAENLPLPDQSCHAILNIEASHLYDDPARFFAEVFRVLEDGGLFFYADLCWQNNDPVRLISAAGLRVTSVENITPNVLQSLELDSERRERITRERIPAPLQADFRDWSGVKGYRAYRRFQTGEWVYHCIRATRPA